MKLSYPAPRTPNGRVYRFSPNEQAHPRHFVLGDVVADINVTDAFRARMKHDPRTTQTVCPYSGTVAEDGAFVHPDDVKAAVEMVKHDAVQDVQDALSEMLKNAFKGSSSNNSFIKVTANNQVIVSRAQFGNYIIFIICSIVSISGYLLLSTNLINTKIGGIFKYFGYNSIIVLSTHYYVLSILNYINYIYRWDMNRTLAAVIVLILEIPIIYVINKYLSFMIGKTIHKKFAQ